MAYSISGYPAKQRMTEQVVSRRPISREELQNSGLLIRKTNCATVQSSLSAAKREYAVIEVPAPLGAAAGTIFNAAKHTSIAWDQVHASLPNPGTRVPRDVFVQYCIRTSPLSFENVELYCSYLAYVNALFDMATAMMLPAKKTDLGKHCFAYGLLLAFEFYWGTPADRLCLASSDRPMDPYSEIRSALDLDWSKVAKDSEGRVKFEAFKSYFVRKYANVLTQGTLLCYEAFLKQTFCSCLSMMLPKLKDSLGGHCFRYGALMAGEFYFNTNSAVLDVLAIAK